MFRQVSIVAWLAVAAVSSLALATAAEPKPDPTKQITNSIGMKLTLIPSGEFMMGSKESAEETVALFNKTYGGPPEEAHWLKDEHPRHRVRITKPFYLGIYHVTRGQFQKFVADPGYNKPDLDRDNYKKIYEQTDDHPAILVSWNEAVAFCDWLSKKEGKYYRLPTEAEWEYACRAGTTTRYYCGDNPETLVTVANVADATKVPDGYHAFKARAPAGKFKPNAFGLYDMQGAVWQWCADWYDPEYYAKSPVDDPTGPDAGKPVQVHPEFPGSYRRVTRGGDYINPPISNRSACRAGYQPVASSSEIGFRVARGDEAFRYKTDLAKAVIATPAAKPTPTNFVLTMPAIAPLTMTIIPRPVATSVADLATHSASYAVQPSSAFKMATEAPTTPTMSIRK